MRDDARFGITPAADTDSFLDFIREAAAGWCRTNPRPTTDAAFVDATTRILEDAVCHAVGSSSLPELLDRWSRERGSDRTDELVFLLNDLAKSKRPAYRADIIAAAIGRATREGIPFAQIAKKHGVSRQAFDRAVNEFQEQMGLPKVQGQLSEAVAASYKINARHITITEAAS